MEMKRPVIGILGNRLAVTDKPFWGMERDYVNHDYVQSVEDCGGFPIILPVTADPTLLTPLIGRINGLLLSGGYDIHPKFFGEDTHPLLQHTHGEVDSAQLSLLKEALDQHVPILGICRGFQLLTVAGGGTLYQDTSIAVGYPLKHMQDAPRWDTTHTVSFTDRSLLARLFGEGIETNSFHHMCLHDCPDTFRVTGLAPDGIVEAIEHSDPKQFAVGVQWHPEMMMAHGNSMRPLFESFLSAAARPRP